MNYPKRVLNLKNSFIFGVRNAWFGNVTRLLDLTSTGDVENTYTLGWFKDIHEFTQDTDKGVFARFVTSKLSSEPIKTCSLKQTEDGVWITDNIVDGEYLELSNDLCEILVSIFSNKESSTLKGVNDI